MRVMRQKGMYTCKPGNFYMQVVQAVLLFVSEMWVIFLLIGRTMGGFHRWMMRQLTGGSQYGRMVVVGYTHIW